MAPPLPHRPVRTNHPAHRRARAFVAAVGALLALVGLVVGVPWALIRFVGWPLPHRFPTWPDLTAVLLAPISTGFLLDLLAVGLWIAWAAFTLDVARCGLDAARGMSWPQHRSRSAVHGLAAVLVGALLVPILTGRITPTPTSAAVVVAGAPYRTVAALTVPDSDGRQGRETVVVRAPDSRTGVHDSLWRIAARELGDGARWPDIYALNQGKPQPGGGHFDRPSLVFPGEELRLPPPPDTPTATNPGEPAFDPNRAPSTATPVAAPIPLPTLPESAAPSTAAPSATTITTPSPTLGTSAVDPVPVPPTATPTLAPSTAAAGPVTTIPAPAGGEPGRASAPGIAIGPEAFVGAGLVSAVSAALLLARRRHRRRYRPGSGRRDDLPIAPVVYQLRLAHLRADHDDDIDPESDPAAGWRSGTDDPPDGDADAAEDDRSETDPDAELPRRHPPRRPGPPAAAGEGAPVLGVRDGRPAALDLAAGPGLGLVGDGAPAAARALLVHALTPPDATTGRVVIPAPDLVALLGAAHPTPLPAGLQVTASLDDALDLVEAETLTRVPQQPAPVRPGRTPHPPLVLIAAVPATGPDRARLQAVLDNGSPYGLAGVLLGQWRAGGTAHARADGHVAATDPGPGEVLRGARLFHLGADDTAALLTLLGDVTHSPEPPSNPATRPRPGQVAPDLAHRTVSEAAASTAAGSPSDLEVAAGPPDTSPQGFSSVPADPAAVPMTALVIQPAPSSPYGPHPPVFVQVLGPPRVWWRPEPDDATTAPDAAAQSVLDRGDPSAIVPAPVDVTGLFQPRTRELLTFLAVHPDGATREALTAALWPDTPPERLANAVNTALSRLRRAVRTATHTTITDVVLLGDGRYRLDPGLVATDYAAFADAQAERRRAVTAIQRHTAHQAMIDTYRGPLAEGLSAEWIETLRESIRRDALDAVAALARALVATDPQHTLDLLELARAFDPHNELLYRDIMRLQARLGLLDAVPRTLALLTTRLAELDEHPAPATVELAARLCADDSPLTPEPATEAVGTGR